MTDLEGRSLDEALARAAGWEFAEIEVDESWPHKGMWAWHSPWPDFEPFDTPPEYHADLTALLRDIEPVCRERGMVDWSVGSESGYGRERAFSGDVLLTEPSEICGYGPTAATALARAFLAVLTRGER